MKRFDLFVLALILLIAMLLFGCSNLKPDYLTSSYIHQSQPFVGRGPFPFGNNKATEESNLDGLETGVRWERGQMFYEGDLTYLLRESGHEPGNWVTTFRAGIKVKL